MKTQIKNWTCALLPFVLLLAVVLYFNVERYYAEEDITPELCAKMVSQELKHRDNAPKPENVQILGIQRVDDRIFAGYYLNNRQFNESNFGYLDFHSYEGKYHLGHCYKSIKNETPQIASEFISCGNSQLYILIMSLEDEFRRLETWRRQPNIYDDEEEAYTLLNSIDIPKGPVMVIEPFVSGVYGKLLIVDAEGREIARR